MAQASAAGTTDFGSYTARIEQLRALGIVVVLRGMWIAIPPAGPLQRKLRDAQLTRWRLPALLADVEAAIAPAGHGIS